MIGEKIALCRKKAGMSQEALAAQLGISRQAVSRWETGEATLDTEKVVQLSRLFHVSTDSLLLDEITEAPQNAPQSAPQTNTPEQKRLPSRLFVGKCLLMIGLAGLAFVLICGGFYSDTLDEWYTDLGRYGTALFKTWRIFPLIFSVFAAALGGAIVWDEYTRQP